MSLLRLLPALSVALALLVSGCSSSVSHSSDQSQSSQTSAPAATPTPTQAPDLSAQTKETPEPRNAPKPKSELNVSSLNASVHHLMNSYTSLRSRVSNIIDQIANGANNDDVIGSTGRQWYSDERDFQSQIDALPTNLSTSPQYALIKGNLSEVEAFLYPAGTDAMASCDPHNARKELEVADYFYHAVQKEMVTGVATADDASDPPQVDASEHSCPAP